MWVDVREVLAHEVSRAADNEICIESTPPPPRRRRRNVI